MKTFENARREKGGAGLAVLLLLAAVLIGGVIIYARSPSLQQTVHSVKESTQDAATTSKVHTALLLSKQASPYDIKVATKEGKVMLTGQVPSQEIKMLAGAIGQDVSGVKEVQNQLVVNPTMERDSDAQRLGARVMDLEIKTMINDAISGNQDLKDKQIQTQVADRTVTLNGTVDTPDQKYAVEHLSWVSGVQRVVNNLAVTNPQVKPETADEKLARRVEFELYSTGAIPLSQVQIQSQNGTVTLTGSVGSRAEKLLAEKVAQTVEGVHSVVNDLTSSDDAGTSL
jgi:hyperosmotically inducible protein